MAGYAMKEKRVEYRAIARDDDPDGGKPSFDCGHWSPNRADALSEYDDFLIYEGKLAYDAVWIEKRIVRETIEGPIRLRESSVDKLRKAVG